MPNNQLTDREPTTPLKFVIGQHYMSIHVEWESWDATRPEFKQLQLDKITELLLRPETRPIRK